VVLFAVLIGIYYWFDHRPRPVETEKPGEALVVVTKSTNGCFSDQVRVTGASRATPGSRGGRGPGRLQGH
jgi:hypothetical protein